MCGISGFLYSNQSKSDADQALRRMLSVMDYRGPDASGYYTEDGLGLSHARLSLVGIDNGQQPLWNETQDIALVCAGEVFNHAALRRELEQKGHRFNSQSDCEALVHLYEEGGIQALDQVNGQFAFALWDKRKDELYLARDRFGIMPLYYAFQGKTCIFASEIKSILEFDRSLAEIDPQALSEIFAFWTCLAPRTMFKNILELPPAHYAVVKDGRVELKRYWDLDFSQSNDDRNLSDDDLADKIASILEDAVQIRLAADKAVGAYSSGGFDSSWVAALAQKNAKQSFDVFSIRFEDQTFDESGGQERLAKDLNQPIHGIGCSNSDLINGFLKAVFHAEKPLFRTAPIPFYLLSESVRKKGYSAVLAGEGADEFWLGYNLYKETKIRQFWSHAPESKSRPHLFSKIYPYLSMGQNQDPMFYAKFFSNRLNATQDPFYSHLIRWKSTERNLKYLTHDMSNGYRQDLSYEHMLKRFHPDFRHWNIMDRAQYVEAFVLLNGYLLSSQGDRMAMAHGVEVRYPFLDHRLVELSAGIPYFRKMRGLKEKRLLKKAAAKHVSPECLSQTKTPYRSPLIKLNRNDKSSQVLLDFLTPASIKRARCFDPEPVKLLLDKYWKQERNLSESDQTAFCTILSTQIWHELFIQNKQTAAI